MNAPVFGFGPFKVAAEGSSQFVGNDVKVSMVVGKPLVQRARPDHCQPPIIPFSNLPEVAAKLLPRPKGSSYTQLVLNWWVVSKSDTARSWPGDHELMT